jgi:hypothetical protein
MLKTTAVSDPKPCPKRASDAPYEKTPTSGGIVSRLWASLTSLLTKSHRSELNRRPLLVKDGRFDGISRLFNGITSTFSAFLARKAGKSHPETVPKACLSNPLSTHSLTNPLLHFRFSSEGQQELERIAREEQKQFAFRRHY